MTLIDLSREIYHKMPRILTHPPIVITAFGTHQEIREADGYKFSSATLSIALGDHAGTHVDAPVHFDARPGAVGIDQVPLEDFFLDAVCLDLSHKPLKSDISIDDLEKAQTAAGVTIAPNDTVLLHMDFFHRSNGKDAISPIFRVSPRNLRHGSVARTSACSASRPSARAAPDAAISSVHHVCREQGFTDVEGLVNIEKLIGRERFNFIGFPLKISGGTASPIRAVA